MAKAYWIAFYRSISNPDALAAYAKLAGPAIAAAGGRFLARGNAAKAYESGVAQRVVVIEFDSIDKAVAAHDSEGYQAALKVFGKAADRDLRIDETQEVARAYAAQCTPDFFGFNSNDELQYRGRLDASRTRLVPGARRELFEAMTQVAETGRGPLEQTASMGCSIKWRD